MQQVPETDDSQAFPMDLRGVLKYVPQWRGHRFVIALDGATIAQDDFYLLVRDIAVLRTLGIDLVLVFGIGHQLEREARAAGGTPSDARGEGPTDAATLDWAQAAAGSVGQAVLQALSIHQLRGAWCNAVRATALGILGGVDQGFTGKVERIDSATLRQLLAQELVPVLSPVAFSKEGQPYRLNSDLLAAEVAQALQASKLIYLLPYPGLTYGGVPQLNVAVEEVETLLKDAPERIDLRVRSKARQAVKTILAGTPRAHLIDSRINDGLLRELFSKVGIGSMIHANPYARIRAARRRDVAAILGISRSAVRDEALRARSREDIETTLGDTYVYEIDESVVACLRLTDWPDASLAELASVSVHPAYRGQKLGQTLVAFAVQEAQRRGLGRVVALTTQALPFFVDACGFQIGSLQDLPAPLRAAAEATGRQSRVVVHDLKSLEAVPSPALHSGARVDLAQP